MPSASIAGFLDQAQASRVLFPEQVEQLFRQPDVPQDDLNELCAYLERRGVLTRFQADLLRSGRGHELNFAGYPIQDVIGPCPGGTAYRALHPSLRTPVVLRRMRADWPAPADHAPAFVQRARAATTVQHPNLVPLLDAGVYQDELYAALEAPDAADLDALVKDIGPMPSFLACEFARQVAAGLRAAHERGLVHGDVRPATVQAGPLVAARPGPDGRVRKRPAAAATARLADLGLVPVRPPATQQVSGMAGPVPTADELAYLPPERVDGMGHDPRGDLYGLGATLYYLLAGRPPFAGASPHEVLAKVRSAEPPPLAALRPDLPPPLVALVQQLMAKPPFARPGTAAEVEARLAAFGRPDPAAPPAVPMAAPASAVGFGGAPPAAVPTAAPAPAHPHHDPFAHDPAPPHDDAWAPKSDEFSTTGAADGPRRRQIDKGKARKWLILGGLLHTTALVLGVFLVLYLRGDLDHWFESEEETPATTPVTKKVKRKKAEAAPPAVAWPDRFRA